MGSRTPNIQLRGNIYRLRVRVPDALRKAVGKSEIVRSLGTGNYRQACERARLERVKLDAEWARIRNHQPTSLQERDVLCLVSRWLMAADLDPDPISTEGRGTELYNEAMQDLASAMTWDEIAPTLYQIAKEILKENDLEVSENDPLFLRFQKVLQMAVAEVERRRIIRIFPTARVPLDPLFHPSEAPIASKTALSKTLGDLIRDIQNDPSRLPLRGKTRLKRQAQWRLIENFFGA